MAQSEGLLVAGDVIVISSYHNLVLWSSFSFSFSQKARTRTRANRIGLRSAHNTRYMANDFGMSEEVGLFSLN